MEYNIVKLKVLKPTLAGYLRETQALLGPDPSPAESTIHDLRVLMKKSRALMKLMQVQVESDFYFREYNLYREVGRITSSWRDNSVHRKTLKRFRKNHAYIFSELKNNGRLEEMLKKPDPAFKGNPPEIQLELKRIEGLIVKSGYRIRFQNLNNLDPVMLFKTLEKSYNIVSENYVVCRNNPKPDNIHEFRKKAKDFLYQLPFFRTLNPPSVKNLEKKIDNLTQYIGKVNDLNQLLIALDYKYVRPSSSPALDELALLVRAEQDRYLSKVWPLAYKIFCPGRELVNLLGFKILTI